eukprot:1161178-Pelagomonas_calceolata.AAC.9
MKSTGDGKTHVYWASSVWQTRDYKHEVKRGPQIQLAYAKPTLDTASLGFQHVHASDTSVPFSKVKGQTWTHLVRVGGLQEAGDAGHDILAGCLTESECAEAPLRMHMQCET